MIDKGTKENKTPGFVKTVGFGDTSKMSVSPTGSNPIPIISSKSPTHSSPIAQDMNELGSYKTQLNGWSSLDNNAKSDLVSPKSNIVDVKRPQSNEDNRKRSNSNSGSNAPVPAKEALHANSTSDKARGLTKEERKALYEKTAAQKRQQLREKTEKGGEAVPEQPKPSQNQQKAKSPQATESVSQPKKQTGQSSKPLQFDDPKKRAKADKKKILQLPPSQKILPLFSHLPQYEHSTQKGSMTKLTIGLNSTSEIHPAILQLGLKYAEGTITGANARAVALLTAFKRVILDHVPPPDYQGLVFKDLDLKPLFQFLVDCRPLSMSMGSAINYLKLVISQTQTQTQITLEEAKNQITTKIDSFIQDRVVAADDIIVAHGVSKINDGDVIMTHGRSHVVELIFKKAHEEGKKFKVIVVDSRPKSEASDLLKRLVKSGVRCTYIMINAISYIMKEVTKVFVGASSMMANGYLISRCGTASVAMMARNYHIPFIVCCETYKFTERVQLESISYNELGDPEDLRVRESDMIKDVLKEWREIPSLRLLNLVYDLTPSEFIMMVITEVGMVPPSSVPVILREYSNTNV